MDIQDFTGTIYVERSTNLPTFGGTVEGEIGETGSFAELVIGGQLYTLPIDTVTGKWSWNAENTLPEGDYSVSLRFWDSYGNASEPTLFTLRIDTTPPEAPILVKLDDDVGSVTGSFDLDKATDDKRPELTGFAQKGATVYLRDADGNNIGSAVADAKTGIWVMEPSQDLAVGNNNLTLVAVETFAGVTREGVASDPFTIIISDGDSTLPPNTITISDAFDNAGSATGMLKNGALTDDTTPTLNGDVSSGNTVTVYWRAAGSSSWLGSSTATVTGDKWTWTPGTALPVGEYEFQATISGGASTLFTLDIATAAQIALKTNIHYAEDNFGAAQGKLGNGAISDDTTPELHGRGEANGKVVVRYTLEGGASATVTVDVDSAGNWSWTPSSALATGNWAFDVQAQGQSAWQSAFSLEITDSAGFGPTITGALDNVGDVQDPLANGDTTDDTTPTLRGRAEANAEFTLRYTLAGAAVATVDLIADANGNWTWTAPALAAGDWTFEVRQPGSEWQSFALTIDPNIDRAPTIQYAWDDVGVTGKLTDGSTTDDAMPELRGEATANSLVYLRATHTADSTIYSVMADSSGNWSWKPEADLAKGKWQFEASKKMDANWGETFDLSLREPGQFTGNIDFENPAPNWSILESDKAFYNHDVRVHSASNKGYVTHIEAPADAPNEFGGKILHIGGKGSLSILTADKSFAFDAFSIKLYNPGVNKVTLVINLYGDGIKDYNKIIDILPKEKITLDMQDIVPSSSELYAFNISNNTANSDTIYADNFDYSIHEVKNTTLSAVDLSENHFIDDTNVLASNTITGKESQIDTLILTGKDQLLDLAKHTETVKSIEIFDITGSGDNTLKLDLASLLSHGEKNLFVDDGKTQLLINGDKGDVVQLDDILPEGFAEGSWEQQTGNIVIAGVEYQVYSHSSAEAELLVQEGVKTELL